MTSLSRTLRPALVPAAVAAALVLTGCGSGSAPKAQHGPTSSPTSTSSGFGEPSGEPSADGSASAEPSSPATSTGHARPGFQLVRVKKYGVTYEVPRGWISLSAGGVLRQDSPVVTLLSRRLGQSPQSIVESMRHTLLAISVSDRGAVAGFLENVNAAASNVDSVTDDEIRLQLAQIGARPTSIDHVDSPIGRIVRVAYTMTLGTHRFNGVMLGVTTDEGFFSITVSSHDAASAKARADEVQGSLALIPGGGGTLS